MGWKFTGDKPIHVQLVNEISNRIVKGEYVPGMKLPSVRDFAAQASVNPNTMQKAFTELERTGLGAHNRQVRDQQFRAYPAGERGTCKVERSKFLFFHGGARLFKR